MSDPGDDDQLDGCCDVDFAMAPETTDDDVAALVLFAGTDFADPATVARKADEWRTLFGAGRSGGESASSPGPGDQPPEATS